MRAARPPDPSVPASRLFAPGHARPWSRDGVDGIVQPPVWPAGRALAWDAVRRSSARSALATSRRARAAASGRRADRGVSAAAARADLYGGGAFGRYVQFVSVRLDAIGRAGRSVRHADHAVRPVRRAAVRQRAADQSAGGGRALRRPLDASPRPCRAGIPEHRRARAHRRRSARRAELRTTRSGDGRDPGAVHAASTRSAAIAAQPATPARCAGQARDPARRERGRRKAARRRAHLATGA